MAILVHRTPSVGGVIKKIISVNPELGVNEISDIIRRATRNQGGKAGEFSKAQVIDETLAIELARDSRRLRNGPKPLTT